MQDSEEHQDSEEEHQDSEKHQDSVKEHQHKRKRGLGRTISNADSEFQSGQRPSQVKPEVSGKVSDTMLWSFTASMHRSIPKSQLLTWRDNCASYLEVASVGEVKDKLAIPCGCACSGTGIWAKCNSVLEEYWSVELGLPFANYRHKWMCEIDGPKRAWLFSQHDVESMFCDITTMAGPPNQAHTQQCSITGKPEYPAWVSEYGAGFVCKDVSKQNSMRKYLDKNKLKSLEGATGSTYGGAKSWILKTRPMISWLENVTEVLTDEQEAKEEGKDVEVAGLKKHESKQIKDDFEKEDFTCLFVVDDPRVRGSLCARTRVFIVVVNLPRRVSDKFQLEENFHTALQCMRAEKQHEFESFMIEEDLLEQMCSPLEHGSRRGPPKKKAKDGGDDWESVHQELFLYGKVDWPPDVSGLADFRARSAEVIVFADAMWPVQIKDEWTFFDTNHDAKRLFRWPLKVQKGNTMSSLKCPWRTYIPTLTALSNIVARKLSWHGQEEKLTLRRVHPLECMRVMGWDLEFFKESPFKFAKLPSEEREHFLDSDLLGDMVGNAWCAWTYTAIKIALCGAINWKAAFALKALDGSKRVATSAVMGKDYFIVVVVVVVIVVIVVIVVVVIAAAAADVVGLSKSSLKQI